jgi:phospholipid-translocating ATPase
MRALSIRRRTPEKNDADLEQVRENFETNQQQDGRGVVFDIDNEEELSQRRVYVNQHLPAELLDEDGSPLQQFSRNKIRTAKYTPLIFVPKNLWLQFHNIANIYFLFVTILAVRLL